MKRSLIRIPILCLLVLVIPQGSSLDACTTFCLDDGACQVFGRNYDWSLGVGLVIVNKKGLSKTAFIPPFDKPATWNSKYGSITFNQYGREFPTGGMNEAGLVIEEMWLQGTEYPARDERPALREQAWIQYQLDNFDSVDEVVASDADVRISLDSTPLHFLICDCTGETAVIEFLNGKMVVHRGEELPFKALANSTYEQSLGHLKCFKGFGGEREFPLDSTDSMDRFARAAWKGSEYTKEECGDANDFAFKILEDVSQGRFTQWSIVYDVKNLAIRFKTRESPKIKILHLKDFDFSCETPCRVLDIDTDKAGNVHADFTDYTREINKKLVYDSWKNTSFMKDMPELIMNMVACHPETFKPVKQEK